jgi:hypothetical protein
LIFLCRINPIREPMITVAQLTKVAIMERHYNGFTGD